MSKTQGRTGARARANIPQAPTPVELETARREVVQIMGRLADIAAGHPSVKTLKARLRSAEAVIARAANS